MYCCLFDCVISLCREACYLFEMDTSCMPLYFIVFVFFVGRYSISLEQIPDVWIYYDTQPWPSEYLIFNHAVYAFYNSEFCSFWNKWNTLLTQPHLTFLDRMTLAVFEDSGWYSVDYSQAEDFLWGKGSNLVSVLHADTNRYEILTVILVS